MPYQTNYGQHRDHHNTSQSIKEHSEAAPTLKQPRTPWDETLRSLRTTTLKPLVYRLRSLAERHSTAPSDRGSTKTFRKKDPARTRLKEQETSRKRLKEQGSSRTRLEGSGAAPGTEPPSRTFCLPSESFPLRVLIAPLCSVPCLNPGPQEGALCERS